MVSCNYEVPFATEILKVNLTKTNQCELCYWHGSSICLTSLTRPSEVHTATQVYYDVGKPGVYHDTYIHKNITISYNVLL